MSKETLASLCRRLHGEETSSRLAIWKLQRSAYDIADELMPASVEAMAVLVTSQTGLPLPLNRILAPIVGLMRKATNAARQAQDVHASFESAVRKAWECLRIEPSTQGDVERLRDELRSSAQVLQEVRSKGIDTGYLASEIAYLDFMQALVATRLGQASFAAESGLRFAEAAIKEIKMRIDEAKASYQAICVEPPRLETLAGNNGLMHRTACKASLEEIVSTFKMSIEPLNNALEVLQLPRCEVRESADRYHFELSSELLDVAHSASLRGTS